MIENFEKVLVVAAHPDDEVLGCGGLIKKLTKSNKQVKVIFLAEGSSCRFPEKDIQKDEVKKEIQHRENCAKKALKIINVNSSSFYNLKCGRLNTYPIIDLGKIVEDEIHKFKPSVIITHSNFDVHHDHLSTFQACLQATRPSGKDIKVDYLFSFEILSSTEWRYNNCFEPNVFVNIEEEIKYKIMAIKEYDSELRKFPHPRSEDGINSLAKYRGMQSGFKFAESFKLVRCFKK